MTANENEESAIKVWCASTIGPSRWYFTCQLCGKRARFASGSREMAEYAGQLHLMTVKH